MSRPRTYLVLTLPTDHTMLNIAYITSERKYVDAYLDKDPDPTNPQTVIELDNVLFDHYWSQAFDEFHD